MVQTCLCFSTYQSQAHQPVIESKRLHHPYPDKRSQRVRQYRRCYEGNIDSKELRASIGDRHIAELEQ